MPAFYAHDRFGQKVFDRLKGETKEIVEKYYKQFEIGLQGPDLFFFFRPYGKNKVVTYGNHLHEISAYPFFEHSARIANLAGEDSASYAYLLGFICHFILDSECHPYVAEMIEKTGVQHLEIEEEFEKLLLRKDGKDPLAYKLHRLIPTDTDTAEAIVPFYPKVDARTVWESLIWMKLVKALFRAPHRGKRTLLTACMKAVGKYDYFKGLMHQPKDHPMCKESNEGLMMRFDEAIDLAVTMIESFDESVKTGLPLNQRFDRTFE